MDSHASGRAGTGHEPVQPMGYEVVGSKRPKSSGTVSPTPTPQPVEEVTAKPDVILAVASQEPSQSTNYDALLKKHFGSQWRNAQKVMMCESGGKNRAHNYSDVTHDDSWGLFQINRYGNLKKSRPSPSWLTVPENNIAYAAGMQRSQGWHNPWKRCSRNVGIK